MFGTQNMATQLLPGAQQALPCLYYYSGGCWNYRSCWYGYFSCYAYTCGHFTCHYGYITFTDTIYQQAQPCLPSVVPPVVGGPGGDPVEALRALREQLEVALAGVRAQEEELRRQRSAAGGEGGQQGRGGRGGRAQRSE